MEKPELTFGPIVIQNRETGDLSAKCYHQTRFDCTFRIGGTCTHVRPSRKLEDLPLTPDWCEMKESALADAREMAGLK